MKTQLICGVQNIIAIDLGKKETFQQKRKENLKSKKESNVTEFKLPEAPVEISPEVTKDYNESQVKTDVNPLTNAGLLSQSFEKEISTENLPSNNDAYLEIINDATKGIELLDGIISKAIKLMPTLETTKEPAHDLSTPIDNNQNQPVQDIENKDLQPFASNQNIFDVPQGPNL